MNYVVGFYISWDLKKFVMIKKKRPAWQAGKYNGIGGKIEHYNGDEYPHSSELPKVAMAREFEEETGVLTNPKFWHCFHIEQYKGSAPDGSDSAKVYYFCNFGDAWSKVQTMTDEDVVVLNYEDCTFAPEEFMFNISYLWMMILSQIKSKTLNYLNPEGVNS